MANSLDKSRQNQRPFKGTAQKIQTRASYSEASGVRANGGVSSSRAVNRPTGAIHKAMRGC